MCESFYVHYGFISSSYSMYTVHKLLLMLFYLETKPPEGRMSIKPQDIAIFSNSHLITEIFPRLITSSTKSKLSRSHKHVGWHLEELCIISQISAIEMWRSSRLPPDEKKVEQTEAKRLTHAGWVKIHSSSPFLQWMDPCWKNSCVYVVFCLPVLSMVC